MCISYIYRKYRSESISTVLNEQQGTVSTNCDYHQIPKVKEKGNTNQ